ncbi:CCA tRNA nucleotidyltransferase [Candidatus Micrarchaeota archaeon]|nr:CCA tRNA nucleotidyltransferase [Candidatus Micrarchaeota archaeon]
MKATGIPTREAEMEGICARVIKKATPSAEEKKEEKKIEREIVEKLKALVPAGVEVELMGSVAKNTNLKGAMDFDVFILFPKNYSRKELADVGLEVGRKAAKGHKLEVGYAEHPYTRVYTKKAKIDVVPAYKIANATEVETAVDRSQLHAEYIKGKFTEKTCGEVRLLKKFMKAHEVYGAELKVEGFSGYLCELLVLYYGSFLNALKAASEWKTPVVIDIEKSRGVELAGKFRSAPIIVVDPVDENRNVAAVTSETNLAKFIFAARRFLENPSEQAFETKTVEHSKKRIEKNIAKRGTEIILLQFECLKAVPDVLWPQLRKMLKQIERHLELADFRVIGSDCWTDEKKECLLLFELESATLPSAKKIKGPAVWHAGDLKSFVLKHANALTGPWIDKLGTSAVEKRKHTTARGVIKEIADYPKLYGIPEAMSKKFKAHKLYTGKSILRKGTTAFVGKYLHKTM